MLEILVSDALMFVALSSISTKKKTTPDWVSSSTAVSLGAQISTATSIKSPRENVPIRPTEILYSHALSKGSSSSSRQFLILSQSKSSASTSDVMRCSEQADGTELLRLEILPLERRSSMTRRSFLALGSGVLTIL